MKYITKYPYAKLERKTDSTTGIRHYKTPSGWVASVTTILGQTGDKTWLENWKKWKGEKKANQIRDEASALGTVVHDNMENFILHDRPVEKGTNFIWKLGGEMATILIEQGFSRVEEIWGIEEPLYLDGLYAGTTDLVGLFDGKPAIMDWKNTIKMKKRNQLGDYRCQAVAYALAHNELYGTDIRTISIMMVDRELNFEAFVFEGKEFDESVDEWIARIEEYYEKCRTTPSEEG